MGSEEWRLQNQYFAKPRGEVFSGSDRIHPSLARAVDEQTRRFFGSSRLSANPELNRLGALRKIVSVASFTEKRDRDFYESWHNRFDKSLREDQVLKLMAKEAREYPIIPTEVLSQLIKQVEPSLFIVCRLEVNRQDQYPEFYREMDNMQSLYWTYETFLRSVHGPTIAKLGDTATSAA